MVRFGMGFEILQETVIRWSDPDPKHVPLLRDGGITAVVAKRNAAFEKACSDAGIKTLAEDTVELRDTKDIGGVPAGKLVAARDGLWPGVRGNTAGAGATRTPWVDSNAYRIAYLRALYPKRPPVLGYLPNEAAGVETSRVIPFDSLELALAEAWVSGGNYLLALEANYRESLLAGKEAAVAAWKRLGTTARWLRETAPLFQGSALPAVTALADAGEASAEIINLLYRQNVSPLLVNATAPPAPDPSTRVLVAAGIDAPKPQARTRILAHAQKGATVVVDAPGEKAWWRAPALKSMRKDEDRVTYACGAGRIVAYNSEIVDPSEFALDVVDLVGHEHRAARAWNAFAAILVARRLPPAGPASAVLHVLNYGSPARNPVLVQIAGNYSAAKLLRPDGDPVTLKVARRLGTRSEVLLPEIRRVAVVAFS